MKALDWTVLRGPNIHGRHPAICCRLALDPAVKAELAQRFVALATELQRRAGAELAPGEVRQTRSATIVNAVYGFSVAETGLHAGRLALRLTAAETSGRDRSFDARRAVARFVAAARRAELDLTTAALVREAERRGIPWVRLAALERIVLLGQGCRLTRIRESVTDRTGTLGSLIGSRKAFTNRVLREVGLPVTRQVQVRTSAAAVRAAARLGYPVVVKPNDRGKGINVFVGLENSEAVRVAADKVLRDGSSALVESLVPGDDHRLLVVRGKLVAAARRVPGQVIGDGTSTIAQLVAAVNADPERGVGFARHLERLQIDEEALRLLHAAGFEAQSVPANGEFVALRTTANISTGGTAVDVTRSVHPDNRIVAERAAMAVGLDIAGVDFITPDITRSWRNVGGAICEVNASPGLRPHWYATGSPDTTAAILDSIFPAGDPGRIPIAAVTGTNGKTTTARMVAHVLGIEGLVVGVATTEGVRVGTTDVAHGDFAGGNGARIVLRDTSVQAAVLETARRGILRHGLEFDSCNVGAVLNVGDDHVGTEGIHSREELAQAKRLVVAAARDMAVLNADDALCMRMPDGLRARRFALVSMDARNPTVAAHVRSGQPAVWLDETAGEACLLLHDGTATHPLAQVSELPSAFGGLARHNVQNAMFAAAIAFGLGVGQSTIRRGLLGFVTDFNSNPGRLNVYDGHAFRVIVDYAHNADAMRAMADMVRRAPVHGRRICVLKTQGNRVDAHFTQVAEGVAGAFDRYICSRADDLRGRGPDEVPRRLRDGLLGAGVSPHCIEVVPSEADAVAAALAQARAGDLLVLFATDVSRTWHQVTRFQSA